jgi:hypothetical protein
MKWTFLIGLMFGLGVGYYLGQEEVRTDIKTALTGGSSEVRAFFNDLIGELRSSRASSAALPPSPDSFPRPVEVSKETQDYIRSSLMVDGLDAKVKQAGDNQELPLITGTIINTGERILQRIVGTIYFMGAESIIYEAEVPVFDAREAGYPMQPDEQHPFSFTVPFVPPEWVEGKVRMSITDVAFQF